MYFTATGHARWHIPSIVTAAIAPVNSLGLAHTHGPWSLPPLSHTHPHHHSHHSSLNSGASPTSQHVPHSRRTHRNRHIRRRLSHRASKSKVPARPLPRTARSWTVSVLEQKMAPAPLRRYARLVLMFEFLYLPRADMETRSKNTWMSI